MTGPSRRPSRRPAPSRKVRENEAAVEENESDAVGKQLQTTLSQYGQTEAIVQRLKLLSVAPLKETKKAKTAKK